MLEQRDFAIATTIGARRRQEDRAGFDPQPPALPEGQPTLLAVVADGMGGCPAGDQASRIVVDEFLRGFADAPAQAAGGRLRWALDHANQSLGEAIRLNPQDLQGSNGESAGSTLIAVLFFADRFCWLSVGDSLLLRYRQDRLTRINPLHVYAVELDARVRRREISSEFARSHPQRLALTSAVLGEAIETIDQGEELLLAQDVLLLLTDGVETLGQAELLEICQTHGDHAQALADDIMARIQAQQRAGQDNATAFVVQPGPPDNMAGKAVPVRPALPSGRVRRDPHTGEVVRDQTGSGNG